MTSDFCKRQHIVVSRKKSDIDGNHTGTQEQLSIEFPNIEIFAFDVASLEEGTKRLKKFRDDQKISAKHYINDSEFVVVPGGCLQMGDLFGDGDSDEKPVHEVCVKDFHIGKYEVSIKQWREIMGKNPPVANYADDKYHRYCKEDNCPATAVSWNEVQEFIKKLNKMTGNRYRLPTEAEWEYAAKSGGNKEKWAGTSNEAELYNYAWYIKNSSNISDPVGQKNPNGIGLYDMSGNVYEWVADWYDKNYYEKSLKDNPKGPDSGSERVERGGSSAYYPSHEGYGRLVTTTVREALGPWDGGDKIGFRLVMD